MRDGLRGCLQMVRTSRVSSLVAPVARNPVAKEEEAQKYCLSMCVQMKPITQTALYHAGLATKFWERGPS